MRITVSVLSALIAVLVVCPAIARVEPPRVIALDPPAMGVRILGGELCVGGEVIQVETRARLEVGPAAEIEVRDEPVAIADGEIAYYFGGSSLRGVQTPRSEIRLHQCLKPGTLVVRSEKGERGIAYQAGKDYAVNEEWGAIARKPQGRIPQGATVYASYTYGLERIDTVQVDASGRVTIRRGRNARVCPLPAGAERGKHALANIYVPYHTTAITSDLIYPVGQPVKTVISQDRHRFVAHTLAKLRRGEPVTAVFLGDSVTVGGNASSPDRRFAGQVVARLRRLFPEAEMTLVNAGVGGTNSDFGLERLDRDVIAHKPDLVVIEFAGDMYRPDKIEANYTELITRIRSAGADVIICTSHPMVPFKPETFERAAQALRDVARANHAGLADVWRMWMDLEQAGLPWLTLLPNRFNHPDDRGHRLFARAIAAFFR